MGNCFSLSISSDRSMDTVCQWLGVKASYVHKLEKNLTALEMTMEELKAKRDDLIRRVTRDEEYKGLQRVSEFNLWLTRVETLENIVNDLLRDRNAQFERLCLCGFCSTSMISSYSYGKSVVLALEEAVKLESRVFQVIAEEAQTYEVVERQLQPIIVGQRGVLENAWNHLMEDGVGVMGLHGMGGVGKTTLLTQLHNKFSGLKCGYDFVIWVVVSKELHVEKIQNEIARKVGVLGGEWKQKGTSQKADVIYNFLRKKRFMLFLDDLWEKVDLVEIGIPFPTTHNRCKVAFTTRSEDVCAHMGVDDLTEVQCLSENDAFDLFQRKVGQITLRSDPWIPELARIVAKKCCGLPLALNVVGETMSRKKTIQEWHHAIDVLTNSYAKEFSGMEEQVFQLLKYSYDNLEGEHIKSCLLDCSLFPEDAFIMKKRLIDYWICEGLIDASEGFERAENKGFEIIGILTRASLLTEVPGKISVVCMHDVIREMALWIATDLGTQKEAFIVRTSAGLRELPKVKNWNIVKRMSLMKNSIVHLVGTPECLMLATLLLQQVNLTNISSEFFKSMPKLLVLDLSHNETLYELPDEISELVSLRYLNLSFTGIRYLPSGLQELRELIHLNLEETYNLSSIVGISRLQSLKVLNLYHSGFSLDCDIVAELETLEQLEILTIDIGLSLGLKRFLSSPRLTECTRDLHFRCIRLESSALSLPITMDKLREFSIWDCSIYEITIGNICIKSKTISPLQNPMNPCFLSLSKVIILDCKCLKELTFLMFAPNLRILSVGCANQLEDIVNKEKGIQGEKSGVVPFQKLIFLRLSDLPELKNIYWNALPFPCLTEMDVVRCPNLKKLPLDFQSGKHGENELIIRYTEKEWIEGVEWEDEATKNRFLSSCLLV